ncbi:diacylglycerol kinase [Nocardia cyriacigeorgica]|uniref:diacylglycerol kinase n=1 Tax=Nocardia cyriacigeorgica TaxID=135487 RepID=UPI0018958767|nr:diacylglycerol kinase [Nocardia cyriacigeorgica]MBF6317755.1 diacylglycerol kinase [Nocardia cyriacigeorgica]MBF6344519.1 diacylglycerol kinase [Nocardia cyriacigeorgica]MBF6515353.1 diacylglycerol kinase [Nocardia cyriacigeorgica]MBF6533053.1 diacylglycerol kinase [Nocardia cyriacigeorgica]
MTTQSRREIRKVTVVTNALSGMGKGHDVAAAATARLAECGLEVTEIRAPSAAESVRLVRAEVTGPQRPDAVVCAGGDGLVSVMLEALAETGTPIGLIPGGTGNDLAREFGIPNDDPVAAADVVLGGLARTIDLGLIDRTDAEPMWFATITGTGFDARVTLRANRLRWPKGPLRYTVAALAELVSRAATPYRIELSDGSARPGTAVETDAMLVAVGNTRTYGGGMLVCPDAVVDDGLLDVTVVRAVSRLNMLRLLPALASGKRIDHPAVSHYRAQRITLTAPGAPATADGEPVGTLPITLRAVPGALSILVPEENALRPRS